MLLNPVWKHRTSLSRRRPRKMSSPLQQTVLQRLSLLLQTRNGDDVVEAGAAVAAERARRAL
jgi:hypothetical protein